MRKLVAIATALFLVHTLEEVAFEFWHTDMFSLAIANAIGSSPETVYWLGQALLYLLLVFLLVAPRLATKNWLYTLLGALMLLEIVHVLASVQSWNYTPGLATGIVLMLYGLFFLYKQRSEAS